MDRPHILYVDAYDSFANNITALLQTALDAEVCVVKIDENYLLQPKSDAEFLSYLRQYDAIVVGPGPGNPINTRDVGWIQRIWALGDNDILPVFGICLGFQSLCLAFGANVGTDPNNTLHVSNSLLTDQTLDRTTARISVAHHSWEEQYFQRA
jgi:para-aminobenzoate synthetase